MASLTNTVPARRLSDDEWRALGEAKIAQASVLLREIVANGYGDFVIEVRRDTGITLKPTPWMR